MSSSTRRGRDLALTALVLLLLVLALRFLAGGTTPASAAPSPADRSVEEAQAPDGATSPSDPARRAAPATGAVAEPAADALGWSALREPGRIAGSVRGRGAGPLAGAELVLRPAAPRFGPAGPLSVLAAETRAATDAAGRFSLAVGEGPWSLEVRAEGYGAWRDERLRAGDYRAVELVPAVRLSVFATGADGAPLAGVACSLRDDFRRIDRRPLAAGTTDASGRAVLDGVAPGERYLLVEKPGYQRRVETVDVPRASGWHAVEVRLEPGLGVAGRVLADEDGAPLAGARVRVEAYAAGQSCIAELVTAEDGAFASELSYAPDEPVTVTARSPGRGEAAQSVLLRAPDDGARRRELELRLPVAERRLRGRAVDPRGVPLAGVTVTYTPAAPLGRGREALAAALAQVTPHFERWRSAGTTGIDGAFEVDGLAVRPEHVLLLAAEGRAPAVRWIPSAGTPGTTEVGDVVLQPNGSIAGFVLALEDGEPIAAARVRAQLEIVLRDSDLASEFDGWRPTAWWRPLAATTAADGSFRIEDVAAGKYDLLLPGLEGASVQVDPGTAAGPLVLRVSRAPFAEEDEHTVEGAVLGEDGEPVGDAFVALFPAGAAGDEPLAMTTTDFRGRFELGAPPEGELVLRVTTLLGGYEDHERPLARSAGSLEVRLARRDASEPLIGLVLDPRGVPLADVVVALEPPENRFCGCLSFETRSGADGLVTFRRLGDKDYRVVARDPLGRWPEVAVSPVRAGGYFEAAFR